MTRAEFEARRDELLAKVRALIDAGDIDGATAQMNDIEFFDVTFEAEAVANANLKALEDNAIVPNLENKITQPVSGGKVVDTMNNEITNFEDVVASDIYRNAFYKKLQGKTLNSDEMQAYTSGSSSAGAAIPTQTSNILVKKMLEVAPLLDEITLLRVAGNVTIATQLTRDSAYQHGEGDAITASADALASVTLGSYEFAKLVSISMTVQTMTIDAFEDWLVDGIYEDIALKIENGIIYGNGSTAPGGLASITWTAGTNLISTTASITYDDVCTLMTYPLKGLRKGAKFLCNSSFPYTELAGIKDTSNRPIFVESMKDGVPATLMGKPVLISDEVNDDELYFGQFKQVFGNLSRDIEVKSDEHSGFKTGTIDYRGAAMFDCKVAAPRAFGKFKKN